jgi:hypothetical protein
MSQPEGATERSGGAFTGGEARRYGHSLALPEAQVEKAMTPTQTITLKNLNIEDLKALARQSGPCVSIQVPAYQPGSGGGTRQAHVRQLTQTALERLRNLKRPAEAEQVASALENLIRKLPVEHGGLGMTLFCAPGFEAAFETPAVREQATVASRFHLLPHLAAAQAPQDFFILGLSQNRLRLFHYEGGRCSELPLPAEVPASLEAAGAFDTPEHTLEGRSSGGPSVGAMRGVRFGVSGDHDSEAEYLRHFFEAVDRGLKDTLRGAPLFLAGVHEEVSLYRKAAKYPHILAAECHGNPEHSSLEQIAKHASAGAMREYRATCERALRGLVDVRNKIVEPLPIVEAARAGRVWQLFVAEDGRLAAPATTPATAGTYAEEDFLNVALVEGLRTGAEIFSFPGKEIVGVGAIAAVLRY